MTNTLTPGSRAAQQLISLEALIHPALKHFACLLKHLQRRQWWWQLPRLVRRALEASSSPGCLHIHLAPAGTHRRTESLSPSTTAARNDVS